MKAHDKLLRILTIPIIFLFAFSLGCQEEEVDPCKQTIASPKDLYMTAYVQVLDGSNAGIEGEQVTLRFELHACNGDIVQLATYTTTTDSTGLMGPYTQRITLNNTEDEAFITADAPNLQSTVTYANKTYKYNDFDDDDNEIYTLTIQVQ